MVPGQPNENMVTRHDLKLVPKQKYVQESTEKGLTLLLMEKQGMVKESNPTWYVMVKVRTLPFCPVGVVAYPLALCSIPGRGLQDDLSEFSEMR